MAVNDDKSTSQKKDDLGLALPGNALTLDVNNDKDDYDLVDRLQRGLHSQSSTSRGTSKTAKEVRCTDQVAVRGTDHIYRC